MKRKMSEKSVYSRGPNKRTGRLLENEKKSHLYALIWDYSFINFEQKVPPIRLFPPIHLNIFELFHCLIFGITNYYAKVLIHSLKVGVFWVALNTDYYISRHKLIENKKKSRLYTLIWDYSFINFQQKVPPIRLFSPIFLLIFKEFSHLYSYSDPSSIRNSRVLTYVTGRELIFGSTVHTTSSILA